MTQYLFVKVVGVGCYKFNLHRIDIFHFWVCGDHRILRAERKRSNQSQVELISLFFGCMFLSIIEAEYPSIFQN